MSALGKPVLEGDFDESGQVVVQTPAERVIERSVVVTRTITEAPAKPIVKETVKLAAPKAEMREHARHNSQPPLPYPLAPRPKPQDLKLDRSRDDLLTPFGKATLT